MPIPTFDAWIKRPTTPIGEKGEDFHLVLGDSPINYIDALAFSVFSGTERFRSVKVSCFPGQHDELVWAVAKLAAGTDAIVWSKLDGEWLVFTRK